DDASSTAFANERQKLFNTQEGAAQVNVDCAVPVLDRKLRERNGVTIFLPQLVHPQSRIVDQNIKPAKAVGNFVGHAADIVQLRNIGLDRERPSSRGVYLTGRLLDFA